MNKGDTVFDLTKLGGRVYVGRPNGRMARAHFEIEKHEDMSDFPISVKFPTDARTLTSSFFLGMFGASVRRAGSRDAFLTRFIFDANEQIKEEIDLGITEALIAS